MAAKAAGERPLTLKYLLSCGVIGPLFFIVVFFIEGATRADYDPLRQPVSSLSIGNDGWMQIANFIITGSLILIFAIGLRLAPRPGGGAVWLPLLFGLIGIGLIGAGIFVADPLNGYPPGTPLMPQVRSDHGRLHDLFGIPVFLGLPIVCFIMSFRSARVGQRRWAIYSALAGITMFVLFVLAGMGFRQTPGFVDFAGVFQRLSIISGFTWIAFLALRFVKGVASHKES